MISYKVKALPSHSGELFHCWPPPFHPWCRGTTAPYFDDMDDIAERWARDPKTGKTYTVPGSMTYKQWAAKQTGLAKSVKPLEKSTKNGIIKSNAKGALTSSNDPDFKKRNAHAKRYYSSIRNSEKSGIVDAISLNVDINKETVDKAITHLFFTKHDLYKGFAYFDEDYDIAETIQRLREGRNIKTHDLILLQHEALEADYMAKGMSFEEAHAKAEEQYNYTTALHSYLKQNKLE